MERSVVRSRENLMNLVEYLRKRSQSCLTALGFLLLLFLGVLDYLTGPEISFSILYLLPVSLVTWFTVRRIGILMSIAGAVAWLVADVSPGHVYSDPVILYWNTTVILGFFLIVTFLLSSLKSALEHEKELARLDFLTGVANARLFYEQAKTEIERTQRYNGPLTLAYIDIDDFKAVNDCYGHTGGDGLLRLVAETIQRNIRGIDMVGRLGGDEFAVLLPETGAESAQVVIRRIQDNLLDVILQNGFSTTFSIGVLTYLSPPSNVDDMIRIADRLMYAAKNNGKNMIRHKTLHGSAMAA